MNNFTVSLPGSVDYNAALDLQYKAKKLVIQGKLEGQIIICEHDSRVITLGKFAKQGNILKDLEYLKKNNYCVIEVDRGGDVTLHEPGQVLIYFILPVMSKNIKKFISKIITPLEIFLKKKYSLNIEYNENSPGFWIDNKKIGFIGLNLRDRVSMHGISINVNNSLEGFSIINPCGYKDIRISSLSKELDVNIKTKDFMKDIASVYENHFLI